MKTVVLDADTIGRDLDFSVLNSLGETKIYQNSSESEISERIADCDTVIINKIKLGAHNLCKAKNLKLICIAATGYDNIDVEYCKKNNIAVCNVVGYSTQSVAQLTVAMALSLSCRLPEYNAFVKSGEYTKSGRANRLSPIYHELFSKTWGIVGYGNIGAQVGRIAAAMGMRVIAYKRTPTNAVNCVPLDTLMRESDIISVHTPLNKSTKNLISKDKIALMKKSAILINAARGAVFDEAAAARAIKEGQISGLGIDVYSEEPFSATHPYNDILDMHNVCLTPHIAWAAFEARERCLYEIKENISCFFDGKIRNRVDI